MNDNNKLPNFDSYQEMANFCDSHDLTDYWEQTEDAEFEFSPQARRRYMVSIDRNLLLRIQKMARIRGLTTESMINLFLEQHMHEIEAHA